MSSAVDLTADTFERAINADTPVLVDFWAAWCGPCRRLEPVLDELGAETAGRMTVGKVDVDAEPALTERFEITGIPHLILFRRGEVLTRIVGARPVHDLREALLPLLDAPAAAEG